MLDQEDFQVPEEKGDKMAILEILEGKEDKELW